MDIYSNNDWEDDFSFFFSGSVFVVIFGIHQQTYHGSILIYYAGKGTKIPPFRTVPLISQNGNPSESINVFLSVRPKIAFTNSK